MKENKAETTSEPPPLPLHGPLPNGCYILMMAGSWERPEVRAKRQLAAKRVREQWLATPEGAAEAANMKRIRADILAWLGE